VRREVDPVWDRYKGGRILVKAERIKGGLSRRPGEDTMVIDLDGRTEIVREMGN
jgi:hypothetical protein